MSILKWKVSAEPVGRYSSFENRCWPSATYKGTDSPAGFLASDVAYDGRFGRGESVTTLRADATIVVWVAVYKDGNCTNRCLKARFTDIKAAKAALEEFLVKNKSSVQPPPSLQ
jgi:hypothetical protein